MESSLSKKAKIQSRTRAEPGSKNTRKTKTKSLPSLEQILEEDDDLISAFASAWESEQDSEPTTETAEHGSPPSSRSKASRIELTVRELALLQDACVNWRNYISNNEVTTPITKQRADELTDVWSKLFDFFNHYMFELTPENEKLVILKDTGVDLDG